MAGLLEEVSSADQVITVGSDDAWGAVSQDAGNRGSAQGDPSAGSEVGQVKVPTERAALLA